MATPVARPAAVMVATEVVAEAHVTWLVRSSVVLSESVPVAVNCSVWPLGTLGLAGVTAIDWTTGGVTVITVDPVTPSSEALMMDVPVATAVARPCVPDALEIVAVEVVVAEAQVTWRVRCCVELSENVPTASNWSVSPLGTLLAGSPGSPRSKSRSSRPER